MDEDKDYHYVHNGRNGEKQSVTVFVSAASRRKNGVVESQITKENSAGDNNNFVAVAYKSIKRKTSGMYHTLQSVTNSAIPFVDSTAPCPLFLPNRAQKLV